MFQKRPTVVFVDEAHNFLGRQIGAEDYAAKLDAFELMAKEGRKYGLNICLASQRPRDITEGVLSQMGTLIVHRLTNDRDREVVERACGEIDRAASAFLPNLRRAKPPSSAPTSRFRSRFRSMSPSPSRNQTVPTFNAFGPLN